MQEMVLQRLREIVGPRWAPWVTWAWSLVTRQQMEETTTSNLRQPISPPVGEMTGTNTPEVLAESLGSWKVYVILGLLVASGLLLIPLGFAPDALKKEIPNSVWIIASLFFGIYTLMWVWVTFDAFKREGRVRRSWLNSVHAAWCSMTCVLVAVKYCQQNQTFFSMAPFLALAIWSFVPF